MGICQDRRMKVGNFELHEPVPELREPHAFITIRPWVDGGSVATTTLAQLERHFQAKEAGKLARPGNFFDFTRYRPTIRLIEGRREVIIPNSIIQYAKTEEGPDFLFFHLLEPHSFGEDYSESVLDVFKHFGIKRYCRLGGMYDVVPHTRPLLVTGDFGSVPVKGDGENLRKRKRKSTYQGPTTILNLVTDGVAKLDPEVETINFTVHLPQYSQLEEDYMGTSRLLEVLSSIYDLPPDLAPTDKGNEQYSELDKVVERNSELKNLVKRMESDYDAQEAASQEEASPPPPLSSEVEQFLEEMDRRFGGPPPSS